MGCQVQKLQHIESPRPSFYCGQALLRPPEFRRQGGLSEPSLLAPRSELVY